MKKTTAARTILTLVNVVFLVVAATAVISAIPPNFDFKPGAVSTSGTPGVNVDVTWSYSVTNNGYYAIDNFSVNVIIYDASHTFLASSSNPGVGIAKGATLSDSITVNVGAYEGDFTVTLAVHAEFAYGLLKFTINATGGGNIP